MKKLNLSLAVVAICSLLMYVTSCSKSTYHEPSYARVDFPGLAIGDSWRYQVRDSLTRHLDTLTLTVASTSPSGLYTRVDCYVTDTGAVVDSGYFLASDALISYQGINPATSRLGSFYVQLPFQAGDTWTNTTDSDKITTLPNLPLVSVLGQSYYVFDLTRTRDTYGDTIRQNLQLTRNIGVVSQTYSYKGLTTASHKLFRASLIDYHFH